MFVCSDFGPDLPNLGLTVRVTPTRPMPASPSSYLIDTVGSATGQFLTEGPRGVYPDTFVCPSCAVTVPHFEITCVVPAGYGGQLEWVVEVLDQASQPFR